jgi:hypothetical protein
MQKAFRMAPLIFAAALALASLYFALPTNQPELAGQANNEDLPMVSDPM